MEKEVQKDIVLELTHITKVFPGVKALDDVSFQVERGTVHVLAGENGAGKSTLIKIINGMYTADEGDLLIDGQKITVHTPRYMKEIGVATIHQELSPVLDLTVAENIFLGMQPKTKFGAIRWNKMYRDAQKLIHDLGFAYDAKRLMRTMTTSDMQIIEIIKAISVNAKIIIMDEPSSSITETEVLVLHEKIRQFKKQGISFIYISHKLDEIDQIGDMVTVLRDGKTISTDLVGHITKEQIITRMVGREMNEVYPVKDTHIGEEILEVRNFTRHGKFENISFKLHAGEILGMAGLVGAGRTEVCKAIFGLDPKESGEVFFKKERLEIKSVPDAIKSGIIYLSEDRKLEGLILCRSVSENISLANLRKYYTKGFLNKTLEKKDAAEMVRKLNVKTPSIQTSAGALSGGNQQKLVIAKWLLRTPTIFIMDEPTRGIDVGAKYEIYKIMCDLAAQGAGVIMISSELPEIIGICDRALVMSGGKWTGEVEGSDLNQERIMQYAVGGLES
ncbi:MAG: sugar ABC transporter ATP-binding protein [Lachnospiraceae bacterium]